MIVLAAVAGFVILASVAATLYALVGYRKTWDVPLPATRASTDSSAIARGRYIVYGPGRCADCHSPDSTRPQLFLGQEVPLIGGPGEHTYLGTWSAPNLTPDSATGIGAVSDGQLARMMRHGVNREGRIGLPFMDAFADLTEEDLIAVLSFLRSLPRVLHVTQPTSAGVAVAVLALAVPALATTARDLSSRLRIDGFTNDFAPDEIVFGFNPDANAPEEASDDSNANPWVKPMLRTINAIAAGMRNTG